jgi:hypothetical protein
MTAKELTFGRLVDSIQQVHGEMAAQASKAGNVSLTLRNWIIGYYIREYEQNGADRAEYGEKLLISLSKKLIHSGLDRVSDRELRRYRAFATTYPQIWESATPKIKALEIGQSLISELDKKPIWESPTPKLQVPGKQLVEKLSFTHLTELIKIDENLKRVFYEVECIKGCWISFRNSCWSWDMGFVSRIGRSEF